MRLLGTSRPESPLPLPFPLSVCLPVLLSSCVFLVLALRLKYETAPYARGSPILHGPLPSNSNIWEQGPLVLNTCDPLSVPS